MLDENLIWKEHLKDNESKSAKNIGFLYKAKPHLIKKCLIALCHSLIHAYINYAYIAWVVHILQRWKDFIVSKGIQDTLYIRRIAWTDKLILDWIKYVKYVYQLNILNNVVFKPKLIPQCSIMLSKTILFLSHQFFMI